MTIKQQGGIFGRNPTFNDLTVEGTLTSSGTFAPSGQVTVSEDGDAALVVNRNTNNGTVVQVKQANAEVGYIATQGGDLVVGTGDTSLRFIDSLDCYFPVSTSSGTTRDNAIDIGYTEARYKDLYLGGGIYIQASSATPVAANYLDDYEIGTWTPTLAFGGGSVGITYAVQEGAYTKIGRQVTLTGRLLFTNIGSSTGAVTVTGLPFNAGTNYPASLIDANTGFTGLTAPTFFVLSGGTLYMSTQGATDRQNVTNASFTNGADMRFLVTYFV